jgi:hypothetical protein
MQACKPTIERAHTMLTFKFVVSLAQYCCPVCAPHANIYTRALTVRLAAWQMQRCKVPGNSSCWASPVYACLQPAGQDQDFMQAPAHRTFASVKTLSSTNTANIHTCVLDRQLPITANHAQA